jgi:hypothetical protein
MCKCRLSGTPDLLLSFTNPRILDDVRLLPKFMLMVQLPSVHTTAEMGR